MAAPSPPPTPPECCPSCGHPVAAPSPAPLKEFPCPSCRNFLWFLRRRAGDVVVLTFLPAATGVDNLRQFDQIAAAAGNKPRLVLNLSQLKLVSSLFMGMLVVVRRRVAAARGKMALCGLSRQTKDAFAATNLNLVFDIFDDETAALANV